jgi:hypothetical protein
MTHCQQPIKKELTSSKVENTRSRRKPAKRTLKTGRATSAARELSPRQEAFCREYVNGETAIQAYAAAYRCTDRRVARSAGSRLLTNDNVQRRLQSLRAGLDSDAVLQLLEKRRYLRRVVLTPIGEVDESSDLCQFFERQHVDQTNTGGAGEACVNPSIERVTIRMPDKLKAIELDARLAGELGHAIRLQLQDDGFLELVAGIRASVRW